MSETAFRFMLDEIKSLRLVCKCGSTMDIVLERLSPLKNVIKCPACGEVLQAGGGHYLAELAEAIVKAQKLDHVVVGVSIPAK